MAESREGKFSELFEVIRDYARREYDYQDKALQVLAGSYTFMFESEDMPDARGVVADRPGRVVGGTEPGLLGARPGEVRRVGAAGGMR